MAFEALRNSVVVRQQSISNVRNFMSWGQWTPKCARIQQRTNCFRQLQCYATASNLKTGSQPTPPRKQITVVNDDGRVQWKNLTTGEKAARTTQQTFNFGIVLAGAVGTGFVIYFLYQEVFAPDSKTRIFNQAVDRVRGDARALELLGSGKTIRAYGEPTQNKWTRNRPLASSLQKDRAGVEHLHMHFNVEGSARSGVVTVHMAKGPGDSHYQYQVLSINVPGEATLYLEKAERLGEEKHSGFRMLGVRWR